MKPLWSSWSGLRPFFWEMGICCPFPPLGGTSCAWSKLLLPLLEKICVHGESVGTSSVCVATTVTRQTNNHHSFLKILDVGSLCSHYWRELSTATYCQELSLCNLNTITLYWGTSGMFSIIDVKMQPYFMGPVGQSFIYAGRLEWGIV